MAHYCVVLVKSRADDEIFERIKVDALVTLILQAAQAQREQQLVLQAIGQSPSTSGAAICSV